MNSWRYLGIGLAGVLGSMAMVGCKPAAEQAPITAATLEPSLGPAPDFRLRTPGGEWVDSADLAGKVVVVDFWATWCGPCVKEIPGYVSLQDKYREQGLVFVGISLDEAGPEVVAKFGEKYRVNYPLVMADDQIVAAFGGVQAIPTTFLIDRDGNIRHRKIGYVEEAQFESLLMPLLAHH